VSVTRTYKLPGLFIDDCLDCECDVGEYDFARRTMTATEEQIAELRSRAEHYAHEGMDEAPGILVAAAKALLKALDREEARP
jgi:hypothetical protein